MKSRVTFLLVVTLFCGKSMIAQQPSKNAFPSYEYILFGHHGKSCQHMFFLIDNDGGISGINSIPGFQCNTTISPSVVIENFGSDVLTTATLQYFIDEGTPEYYYWQGALPPYWMDTIVLPQMSVSEGSHTLSILVTEANGTVDFNGGNNGSVQFNVVGSSEPVPYAESFSQPFLPTGFFVENSNGGPSWDHFLLDGYFTLLSCVRMPFYINDVSGDIDDLYMRNIDLSNVSQAQLSFDVAYTYYSEYYWDELKVMVSTDCGNNWDVVYDKQKDDLATAPATDVFFVPGSAQWRNETVDISQYTGNSNVIIKFDAVNGHGNNLYIDNIAIDNNTGIDEVSSKENVLMLYPNPASTFVNVSFSNMNFVGNEISVFNSLGQKIYFSKISSSHTMIPVEQFPSGAYRVYVNSNGAQFSTAPLVVFR
ncbi:MAG TPA: T9SS type A sorting domain-containing protein [Chitinophagales bacterium]|nr:T9SS type A sorting domain-containing protein [Chitinophagales bacterium]